MRRLPVAVLLVMVALAGCNGPSGNRLLNPGFEDGAKHWFWIEGDPNWQPFTVDQVVASSGNGSLATHLLAPRNSTTSLVSGAIQELGPRHTGNPLPPEFDVSVRVDNWTTDVAKTYIQVVMGAFPPAGSHISVCKRAPRDAPCQVAFILGGVSKPPLPLANRRFVFVNTTVPPLREWTHFTFDPREAFQENWGGQPTNYEKLWVYLEARYDDRPATNHAADVRLDVRWDDVYFGD